MTGYARTGFGKYAHLFYYGRPMAIEFGTDANNQLDIGHALLTSIGRELVPICGSTRNQEFYEYVIDRWAKNGLLLSSLIPARQPT